MFNKVMFYEFMKPLDKELLEAEKLEELLSSQKFVPIEDILKKDDSSIASSYGFAPAVPSINPNNLCHQTADYIFFRYVKEVKKIKAAALRLRVEAREKEMKEKLGQERLTKEQRRQVKDEITNVLLRKTIEDRHCVMVMMSRDCRWLAVDGSTALNEEAISCLRKAIGTMPVETIKKDDPESIFTGWVKGLTPPPPGVEIGEEFVLEDADGARVTYKNQSIQTEELLSNIEEGKQVSALSLLYSPQGTESPIKFKLDSSFKLSGLKFIIDAGDYDSEDEAGIADGVMAFRFSQINTMYGFIKSGMHEQGEAKAATEANAA